MRKNKLAPQVPERLKSFRVAARITRQLRQRLVRTAEEYPYSSAKSSFRGSLGPVPQRLKPISLSALSQA